MTDFTPALSRAYSAHIEQPGVSQEEIDLKALEILRGMSDLDIADALMGEAEFIRFYASKGEKCDETIGLFVRRALMRYCKDVAKRVLEA